MAGFLDWLLGNRNSSSTTNENLQQTQIQEGTQEQQQTTNRQESQTQNTTQNTNRNTQQSQTQNTSQTGNQQQQQTGRTQGTQGTTGSQTQQQQVTNLDSATQSALQEIVSTLSSKSGVLSDESLSAILGNSPVIEALQSRATGGNENIESIVKSATDAAKLSYNENEAPQLQRKINATGSEDNSLAILLRNKGASDLATKVGALEGQLRLQADQTDIAAMTAAVNAGVTQGNATGTNDIATIASVLKGASTTATGSSSTAQQTTSDQTTEAQAQTQSAQQSSSDLTSRIDEVSQMVQQQQTMTQQLTQFLSSLFNSQATATDATRTGSSTGEQSGSLIDWVNAIRGGGSTRR